MCINIERESNCGAAIEIGDDEAEIGFWIGEDYWNKGLMSEAVNAILKYIFEDLNYKKVWCGYYKGNEKSNNCFTY